MPQISVLMSVYNEEKYLKEAIDSILNQSFTDFEFLIVDDASVDNSLSIIKSYNDSRIKLIRNNRNLGFPASLNKGLKAAQGKYIARMDSDDVSLSNRFAKQFNFMENNPEITIGSAWLKLFGAKVETWKSPLKHDEIFTGMLFASTIYHAVAFMRREIIISLNEFYNEDFRQAQDAEYWIRLAFRGVKFANLDEIVYKYRFHSNNAGIKHSTAQQNYADKAIEPFFEKLKIDEPQKWIPIHTLFRKRAKNLQKSDFQNIINWIGYLIKANEKAQIFDDNILKREIAKRWFFICCSSFNNLIYSFIVSKKNKLPQYYNVGFKTKLKFFIKWLERITQKLLRFL